MDLRHLPNEEDSCPSQCLIRKQRYTISDERDLIITSFLEVPDGAVHPADATGDPVEASCAHNGVVLIIEQQEPQQCEEQDTNSIDQIHLQLMLASITDEH